MANTTSMIITIELLTQIGEALYGTQWQTDLARALGLKDPRSIRYWVSGNRPIPKNLAPELIALLKSNEKDIQHLIELLSKNQ